MMWSGLHRIHKIMRLNQMRYLSNIFHFLSLTEECVHQSEERSGRESCCEEHRVTEECCHVSILCERVPDKIKWGLHELLL